MEQVTEVTGWITISRKLSNQEKCFIQQFRPFQYSTGQVMTRLLAMCAWNTRIKITHLCLQVSLVPLCHKELKLRTFTYNCAQVVLFHSTANLARRAPLVPSWYIHDFSFVYPIAHANRYMYSFPPHMISFWKCLPLSVVHSSTPYPCITVKY